MRAFFRWLRGLFGGGGGAGTSKLSNIDHVVVLMLENRSFDNMLGKLYPKSATFDGLSGSESNLDLNGQPVPVNNTPGTAPATMAIPTPDPGELWIDMNTQLYGAAVPPNPLPVPAPMSGFVRSYVTQTDEPTQDYVAKNIMHYFTPDQVPVISQLAKQFAVSDRWFASAPCQTWPNRFFVHTATAHGYENNMPPHFPYEMETIFNQLDVAGAPKGWKVYFHDIPQSLTLAQLWPHPLHFRFYSEFSRDAKHGTLPSYSFIEPRYFSDIGLPNDEHPPHDVTKGEQLIADIYNILRASPTWTKTLLIITYDEHGGCYDHVAPGPAVPPDPMATAPFNFDRYGVRVPAVIVSPWVKQGTVLRASGPTPFDHTSIIATLRKRFGMARPLTHRDAVAPDLEVALSLSAPTNLGPERIEPLMLDESPQRLAAARAVPPNDLQKSLLVLAANLPEGSHPAAVAQARTFALARAAPPEAHESVGHAVAFIKQRMDRYFNNP